MRRVASVFLPHLAIERLRRMPPPRGLPDGARVGALPVDDDPGECSVPKRGGWRPGARWARDDAPHRQPPARELGRRSEAADHPFKSMRPDDGRPARGPVGPAPAASARPPLIVAIQAGRAQVVHAACPVARSLGLAPGTAVAHARALVPDLEILPADPDAELALLHRLAEHGAQHWSPCVAVCDPDGIWLDLTGTTHLFGGEERFCARLAAFLSRIGLTARVAIADTPGAAHALARFGRRAVTVTPAGRTVEHIAGLPVGALRLGADAIAACRRFGLERVADLLPMPRGPLTRRLGARTVERLDQAIGRVAEPIEALVVEEPPEARRRMLEPIGTPEAIGQVIEDVVGDLAEAMRERGVGCRSLRLAFLRVDGTEQRITVGTAKATRDPAHLGRLLKLQMERIDPGMGIEEARIVATTTEPLGAEAIGPVLAGERRDRDLAPLIDQIAGRVGRDAAFRNTVRESDVPERCVDRTGALAEAAGWPAWSRPARMLRRPEPLHGVVALLPDHPPRRFTWRGEVHDVVAGDGPERIHGEWWVREGEVWAVRDYYRVEDGGGRRFWIFRRGDGVDGATGDLSWWIHGAFG